MLRATQLSKLTAQVPVVTGHRAIKNIQARSHRPTLTVRPKEIRHVQQCVRWALKYRTNLTVLGGGHSGHCIQPDVVAVDMSAFNQVQVFEQEAGGVKSGIDEDNPSHVIVAEAGSTTGDIIRSATAVGLNVPLGARPSVGAGSWLQGGIGHLARLYGLASDAIIGAIIIGVDSGQILCVGCVPSQYIPAGAVRPEHEADLLWAIKGAGTMFGIVVSVTFKVYKAPTYLVRNRVVLLGDGHEAQLELRNFSTLTAGLMNRNCSADAYLYWEADQLRLAITTFESTMTGTTEIPPMSSDSTNVGLEDGSKTVDGISLFETEMYVSGMHGGHGGGKTSSFKRCLFLKDIGKAKITDLLITAIKTRPSPICYVHLLQGGEAVGDVAPSATAFGCRDWDFACVVTGAWPRDKDDTELAQSVEEWVYNVARDLLPLSCGAYGADLGPDPRNAMLAARAFGPNSRRVAQLKKRFDPHNVLAFTCPAPKVPTRKLIVLVTGESCAGKDYCANIWSHVLAEFFQEQLSVRVVSISDATKREYAAATGADIDLLLGDRSYKEKHRPMLTSFFQEQVKERPLLPEEHFWDVVHEAGDVDVLLITGMRDTAPVATFSHLVPESKLIEIHIQATEPTRLARGGSQSVVGNGDDHKPSSTIMEHCPTLIFRNDTSGNEAVVTFAKHRLFPFLHHDLERLAEIVHSVFDFPHPGIEFRHVLGISQQVGGLSLCTNLLQSQFAGDWTKIDAIACCEVGGFIYASALALRTDVPLVLVREAGKLPSPTISVPKPSSYISMTPKKSNERRIEMERDAIAKGASVVVVDDVLSTGETLCAVLQLLHKAGVDMEDISIIVVAEFPAHRGRYLLRERGFGRVNVQSLLVFGGS